MKEQELAARVDISHTLGPWETQERDAIERGIAIIAVHPNVPKGGTPTRGMVAWVGQGGANFGAPRLQEANAHLIAAAPDLYASLKQIDRAIAMSDAEFRLWLAQARAAIAKAEGGH